MIAASPSTSWPCAKIELTRTLPLGSKIDEGATHPIGWHISPRRPTNAIQRKWVLGKSGIHETTVADIEEYLVKGFPTSTTRPKSLTATRSTEPSWKKLPIEIEQLIDGSFTSTKNDPSDLKMVCFADAAVVDALSPAQKFELQKLVLSSALTKTNFHCDTYFCPTVPQTHPNFPTCRQARKYWLGEFGYDRQEVPKGILRTLVVAATVTTVAASAVQAPPPGTASPVPGPGP